MMDEHFANDLRIVLTQLAEEVERVNRANGWYDKSRSFGDDVALLSSEASEMFDAYRNAGYFTLNFDSDNPGKQIGEYSKNTAGAEAADILIRLMDTVLRYHVDIAAETVAKLAYNATRSYRHGGRAV
jgi:hypothetical protein